MMKFPSGMPVLEEVFVQLRGEVDVVLEDMVIGEEVINDISGVSVEV